MPSRSKRLVARAAEDSYLELVRAFPLRPIRSYTALDRAIAVVDSLLDREDLDSGAEDYLGVLSYLVNRYEAEHDPIAPVPDAEMVRFLLDSNDMAQSELAERSEISESTISEILAGRPKFSRRHMRVIRIIDSTLIKIIDALIHEFSNSRSPQLRWVW